MEKVLQRISMRSLFFVVIHSILFWCSLLDGDDIITVFCAYLNGAPYNGLFFFFCLPLLWGHSTRSVASL